MKSNLDWGFNPSDTLHNIKTPEPPKYKVKGAKR